MPFPPIPASRFFHFQIDYLMKLILVIPAAGLLFSGALSLNNVPNTNPSLRSASSDLPSAAGAPRMWSDTDKLYKGESFHLYFASPHAAYLGVIDPDGHFFYVVFPAGQSSGQLKPFVTSEQFATVDELLIQTTSFKADPYTDGVLENKRVFTKSGVYRFLLGDNLHTDDAQSIDVVKVRYRHKPRPEHRVVAYAAR